MGRGHRWVSELLFINNRGKTDGEKPWWLLRLKNVFFISAKMVRDVLCCLFYGEKGFRNNFL